MGSGVIIGTAGHIDHGKSALVEALTGQPMDPLAEERRRGITIDLHFAGLRLPDGRMVGVVDVPGHEDLVRTMVAGAAGIDLVLLVVAADEGIMPQSREHLAVVEQLRIPAGIPVITKSDLVDPEWLAMITGEVSEWLRESPVTFSAPLTTSARSGSGIPELREAIAKAREAGGRRDAGDLARLPIDRVFSLPGAGTVVTGTAWSGTFKVGDAVQVLPGERQARIRSIERHGESLEASCPGDRIAVGLAGIDREDIRRGQQLVAANDPWEVSTALDVQLELLDSAARPIKHLTRLRVHLGTAEVLARVHGREPVMPGTSRLVRLVLEEPLLARGGDRLVMRSYSPVVVLGGGWVVDPLPPAGKGERGGAEPSREPRDAAAALLDRRPLGVSRTQLPILLGLAPTVVASLVLDPSFQLVGDTVISRQQLVSVETAASQLVAAYHHAHPAEPGMPLETLRHGLNRFGAAGEAALSALVATGLLVSEGALIREATFRPALTAGDPGVSRIVARIEEAGLAPPSLGELEESEPRAAELLRVAAREGRIIAVERDRYFGKAALDGFALTLGRLAGQGAVTPAAVRDATGLSRKFTIPLLEWADRAGLTVRRGDVRLAGPGLKREIGRAHV